MKDQWLVMLAAATVMVACGDQDEGESIPPKPTGKVEKVVAPVVAVPRATIDVPTADISEFSVRLSDLVPLSVSATTNPENAYSVYKAADRLIYKRENCTISDREIRFVLHYYPTDKSQVEGTGKSFVSADFAPETFYMDGGDCYTTGVLPDFDVEKIVTGQWERSQGTIWNVTIEGSELN